MLKYLKLFEQFITEKKPKGAPEFHHSDAPDAEGRFKDLSIKDLAAWLIKTRKKDVKKISGSLTQQIVFNRKSDPKYAEKMEKTRKEVYKQLGREDLLKEYVVEVKKPIDITVGGKEYKLTKKGSKITLTNTKLSADKLIFRNEKEFKEWADDQVEPIGGTQSSHFGINESVNNKDYFKKVVFLMPGSSSNALSGLDSLYQDLNDECLEEVFESFFCGVDKDRFKEMSEKQVKYLNTLEVSDKKPIVYYGGEQPAPLLVLKNNKISETNMYNTPTSMGISAYKSKFYKLFKDSKFICKTEYDIKNAANNLKFPIIAKPDAGHSGSGIEIFETSEDLQKSKNKFENYSEAKNLKAEYRVMAMNDSIISIYERVSKDDNAIKDKKPDDYVSFVYVKQDLSKLDFVKETENIIKEIRSKVKAGVWSVDLMIDENNDKWVAEINSASGLSADRMCEVYSAVYEDFYKEELPKEVKSYIYDKYTVPVHKINVKENGKYIKKSKTRSDEYTPYF